MKIVKLAFLPDGAPFTLPCSGDTFKNLYLIKSGDCTCRVAGFRAKVKDDGTLSNNYEKFSDFFAPGAEVIYDDTRQNLKFDDKGNYVIAGLDLGGNLDDTEKVENNKVSKKSKGKNKNMDTNTNNANNTIDDTNDTNIVNAVPKGKRGRARKHFVELPKNREFTAAQLATELGVEKFAVNNEITKMKKLNPASVVTVRTEKNSSGKGKPTSVFKII
jgi:predicted transcriptional regulator